MRSACLPVLCPFLCFCESNIAADYLLPDSMQRSTALAALSQVMLLDPGGSLSDDPGLLLKYSDSTW